MRKLPPLNALKAFCAASQHQSFSRAADDLHVTHGAVSRHIRQLEDILGVRLFHRLARGVELTEEGKNLAFTVQQAFDTIADATESLLKRPSQRIVSISTVPSIAARWLVPRLEKFQRKYPEIEIRISTSYQLVDLRRDDVDFVIRYGLGDWPGLQVESLFSRIMSTVCSPELLEAHGGQLTYDDLSQMRLLVSDGFKYWEAWFRKVGIDGVKPGRVMQLLDANVAIEAAVRGQGVALLPTVLVRDEVKSGRLVNPFPDAIKVDLGYYLGMPMNGAPPPPHVVEVIDWIRAEAHKIKGEMALNLLP